VYESSDPYALTRGFYRLCIVENEPNPFADGAWKYIANSVAVDVANLPPPSGPPSPPSTPPPSLPPPSSPMPSPPHPPPISPPSDQRRNFQNGDTRGLGTCVSWGGSSSTTAAEKAYQPLAPPPIVSPKPPPIPPPCGVDVTCAPPGAPASSSGEQGDCLTVGGMLALLFGGFAFLICLCCCIVRIRRAEERGVGPRTLKAQFDAMWVVPYPVKTPYHFSDAHFVRTLIRKYFAILVAGFCALLFAGLIIIILVVVKPLEQRRL